MEQASLETVLSVVTRGVPLSKVLLAMAECYRARAAEERDPELRKHCNQYQEACRKAAAQVSIEEKKWEK